MRLRRQHAWGAVLLVLFVLPVIQPDGIPALERPIGSFFAWFAGIPALNPGLWGRDAVEDEDSPRLRALEAENAQLREGYAERLRREDEAQALREALHEVPLDRMPTALRARILRAADPSGYRRSLLLDRGSVDGLERGQAVVSGSVFLGRVEVVQGRSALVELFSDPQSRLAVAVRTGAGVRVTGYVHGGPGRDGDLDVRYVRVPEGAGRLEVGAAVLTSNLDPLVPAGLLVGYLTEVDDKDADGVPRLRMRPALDLGRVTSAIVLVP